MVCFPTKGVNGLKNGQGAGRDVPQSGLHGSLTRKKKVLHGKLGDEKNRVAQ